MKVPIREVRTREGTVGDVVNAAAFTGGGLGQTNVGASCTIRKGIDVLRVGLQSLHVELDDPIMLTRGDDLSEFDVRILRGIQMRIEFDVGVDFGHAEFDLNIVRAVWGVPCPDDNGIGERITGRDTVIESRFASEPIGEHRL